MSVGADRRVFAGKPPEISALAAQIILHPAMVARKVEKQNTFVCLKNQPPRQTRPAFVKMFAQFADGKPRVRVRISKTFGHQFERGGNLGLPPGFPHDFLEPLGQFNGNHPRLR